MSAHPLLPPRSSWRRTAARVAVNIASGAVLLGMVVGVPAVLLIDPGLSTLLDRTENYAAVAIGLIVCGAVFLRTLPPAR
ncbi:hypothetical protein Lfu02_15480 [Longispora fulva]|uniref:Uncharacterized protein n=1 Tax=Longispora fulva TaxID=619741 RepID=A0A8J7KT83_9ACTN|nr:hypothetical protein [Longispora fulva]MBG6140442.1 hypothetical protein [Longispora fulva]GIG57176.1 hypothetical protein Lfu02_15480 [Longispora fulva]